MAVGGVVLLSAAGRGVAASSVVEDLEVVVLAAVAVEDSEALGVDLPGAEVRAEAGRSGEGLRFEI